MKLYSKINSCFSTIVYFFICYIKLLGIFLCCFLLLFQPNKSEGNLMRKNFLKTPIKKIKSPSFKEIYSNFISKKQPVIIQGDMEDWPGFRKWSIDFFKEHYGHDEVEVTNFPRNDANSNEFTTSTINLKDYIASFDIMNWKDKKRPPYLSDWHCLEQHPELLNDFQWPKYVNNWAEKWKFLKDLSFLAILIGPKNAVYNLHTDAFGTHAFIAQFFGRKRVLFFPPNQKINLYNGLVDPDLPDYDRYPLFEDIQGAQEGILEPGEILFVPSMWWHQVTSLSNSVSLIANVINSTNFLSFISSLSNPNSFRNFMKIIKSKNENKK